jgi:hypothetical protein
MKRLLLLLVVTGLAGCAGDQQHRKPPEAPFRPVAAMLTKYITNKDGTLTHVQLEAGLHADFNAADKNHSNCLDADETRAINQQRYAEDQSTYSPLVDFKGKGCIDFDEFAATPNSLFDTLDRDGNGILTPQEINPYAAPAKTPAGDDNSSGRHHRHGGGGTPPDQSGSNGN